MNGPLSIIHVMDVMRSCSFFYLVINLRHIYHDMRALSLLDNPTYLYVGREFICIKTVHQAHSQCFVLFQQFFFSSPGALPSSIPKSHTSHITSSNTPSPLAHNTLHCRRLWFFRWKAGIFWIGRTGWCPDSEWMVSASGGDQWPLGPWLFRFLFRRPRSWDTGLHLSDFKPLCDWWIRWRGTMRREGEGRVVLCLSFFVHYTYDVAIQCKVRTRGHRQRERSWS